MVLAFVYLATFVHACILKNSVVYKLCMFVQRIMHNLKLSVGES